MIDACWCRTTPVKKSSFVVRDFIPCLHDLAISPQEFEFQRTVWIQQSASTYITMSQHPKKLEHKSSNRHFHILTISHSFIYQPVCRGFVQKNTWLLPRRSVIFAQRSIAAGERSPFTSAHHGNRKNSWFVYFSQGTLVITVIEMCGSMLLSGGSAGVNSNMTSCWSTSSFVPFQGERRCFPI